MSRFAVFAVSMCLATMAVADPERADQLDIDYEALSSKGPTGYVVMPKTAFTGNNSLVSNILFLNRCVGNCQITTSTLNDSRTNESAIPARSGGKALGSVSTITAFGWSDEVWQQLVDCVRETYAPFNVEVVTTDPGPTVLHHEAIVAGVSSELGLDGSILGIASVEYCEPADNVISFSFANMYPPNQVLSLCATVAQESAHAYGLDHEFDCSDPMTYLPQCGQQFFRDKQIRCGEYSGRDCRCSGGTQNSHALLYGVFGPGTLPSPPTVSITLPTNNSTVSNGFSVFVEAFHKRGLKKIELYLNGWKWNEVQGRPPDEQAGPYTLTTPANVPDGVIEIEARAYNDLGVPASQIITVTKGAPCTSADSCAQGQSCDAGKCFWPPATGELGDACDIPQDCLSGLCQATTEAQLCSQDCFVGISDACPTGFSCLAQGTAATGVCWPAGDEGGGCCSANNHSSLSVAIQLFLAAGVGLIVLRRRRRRA